MSAPSPSTPTLTALLRAGEPPPAHQAQFLSEVDVDVNDMLRVLDVHAPTASQFSSASASDSHATSQGGYLGSAAVPAVPAAPGAGGAGGAGSYNTTPVNSQARFSTTAQSFPNAYMPSSPLTSPGYSLVSPGPWAAAASAFGPTPTSSSTSCTTPPAHMAAPPTTLGSFPSTATATAATTTNSIGYGNSSVSGGYAEGGMMGGFMMNGDVHASHHSGAAAAMPRSYTFPSTTPAPGPLSSSSSASFPVPYGPPPSQAAVPRARARGVTFSVFEELQMRRALAAVQQQSGYDPSVFGLAPNASGDVTAHSHLHQQHMGSMGSLSHTAPDHHLGGSPPMPPRISHRHSSPLVSVSGTSSHQHQHQLHRNHHQQQQHLPYSHPASAYSSPRQPGLVQSLSVGSDPRGVEGQYAQPYQSPLAPSSHQQTLYSVPPPPPSTQQSQYQPSFPFSSLPQPQSGLETAAADWATERWPHSVDDLAGDSTTVSPCQTPSPPPAGPLSSSAHGGTYVNSPLVGRISGAPKPRRYPRSHTCREPERSEFTTDEEFQKAWATWRQIRDCNNEAVRKSRNYKKAMLGCNNMACMHMLRELKNSEKTTELLVKAAISPNSLTRAERKSYNRIICARSPQPNPGVGFGGADLDAHAHAHARMSHAGGVERGVSTGASVSMSGGFSLATHALREEEEEQEMSQGNMNCPSDGPVTVSSSGDTQSGNAMHASTATSLYSNSDVSHTPNQHQHGAFAQRRESMDMM